MTEFIEFGMRNSECGMRKEKKRQSSECGMRNVERKKEDRVLNSELGMRNVELKKVKCLIFISWSLSPTRCAIITS